MIDIPIYLLTHRHSLNQYCVPPAVDMVYHLLHLGFGGGHSQLIPQVFSKDTLLLKYFTKPSLMGVVNGRICANCPYWHERIDWELRCYQPIWPGLVMYRIHFL